MASAKDTFDHIVLAIPPAKIAEFKAVVESYDNLATLRTEDPRRHHLKLYFSSSQRETVEQLLAALADRFEIQRIS
jgi:hypothetical protein